MVSPHDHVWGPDEAAGMRRYRCTVAGCRAQARRAMIPVRDGEKIIAYKPGPMIEFKSPRKEDVQERWPGSAFAPNISSGDYPRNRGRRQ